MSCNVSTLSSEEATEPWRGSRTDQLVPLRPVALSDAILPRIRTSFNPIAIVDLPSGQTSTRCDDTSHRTGVSIPHIPAYPYIPIDDPLSPQVHANSPEAGRWPNAASWAA